MRLIILGPPGSGKGTQAKLLCERLTMAHIATGDILREAVRVGTPRGLLAKPYMDQGKYVPDALVNDIIAERLGRPDRPESFVMDGYPRTLAQAQAFAGVLDQVGLQLDAVVLLRVSDGEIVNRVAGRRVCPKDGSLYHVINHPPKVPEHCDLCGSMLEHRDDDQEGTIRERLRVFHATMPSIIEFYRQQNLLREVSGTGAIQDVNQSIRCALGTEVGGC
jgi:adenylate kinase